MAQYYLHNGPSQHALLNQHNSFPSSTHHNHHGGRSRRGGRFNNSQSSTKPFKPIRQPREVVDTTPHSVSRKDFEAARSFDLEDDEAFCPWHLLTEDDLHSIHSSSSDRSSSSGDGSPESSPLQPQLQPTSAFALSATAQPHLPSMQHSSTGHLKLHQPLAQRTRNAIPIVNPNSRHTSPPNSISPARGQHKVAGMVRRDW